MARRPPPQQRSPVDDAPPEATAKFSTTALAAKRAPTESAQKFSRLRIPGQKLVDRSAQISTEERSAMEVPARHVARLGTAGA